MDALRETRLAFDAVAPRYLEEVAGNVVLDAIRRRTRQALLARLPPGGHLLELGCGPGTDALALAAAGYRVTATDWSPAMVAVAERRLAKTPVHDRVVLRVLGIHELERLPAETFDAAFSNLGAFNCVPDLDRAGALVHRCLRGGGILVASVMGRVCPWEWVVWGSRFRWARVAVRFARGGVTVPFHGHRVWTRYYRPREFIAPFAHAGFQVELLEGLAVLAPPPPLAAWARRHPRLVSALFALEDRVARWPVLRATGDHFLVVLRNP